MPADEASHQLKPQPLFKGYGHRVSSAQRADWQNWAERRAQAAYRQGTEAALKADYVTARRWLDRAARLAKGDLNVESARAFACFALKDWKAAAEQFELISKRVRSPDVEAALAVALHKSGRVAEACAVAEKLLGQCAPPEVFFPSAIRFSKAAGRRGWCGVSNAGFVLGHADGPVTLRLDGVLIADCASLPFRLPAQWVNANLLTVTDGDLPLLGSDVDLQSVRQTEGFVRVENDLLQGWIWHPHDPKTPAQVVIRFDQEMRVLQTDAYAEQVNRHSTLHHARRFEIPLSDIPRDADIKVTDLYGINLAGSPVTAELRATMRGETSAPHAQQGADNAMPTPRLECKKAVRASGCLVIVPVYRGRDETRACLASVLAAREADFEILVVNDASPELKLVNDVAQMAARGDITLLNHATNEGFVRSVNDGLARAQGRDVIILNSDAMVFGDGLQRLLQTLDSHPDIGTATPFSNHATIFSFPEVERSNSFPSPRDGAFIDHLFAEGEGEPWVEAPTGHGFCMAIRGDCLKQTGLLRESYFAQGYGEENDFCRRAFDLGWRNVAATRVYVAHHGHVSFSATRDDLMARNLEILEKLHPGYHADIAAFVEHDPYAALRQDVIRRGIVKKCAESTRQSIIIVTHDAGGGVERVVQSRTSQIQSDGLNVIIIRPHSEGCEISLTGHAGWKAVFHLAAEWGDMLVFLQETSPVLVEIHHLVGHAPLMHVLPSALALSADVFVHDYAWFCPRVTLLSDDDQYCGEPDIATCQSCVRRLGSLTGETIPVDRLIRRSENLLRAARRVVVPSEDTARRMRRHFGVVPLAVIPPEGSVCQVTVLRGARSPIDPIRVCVVGAIGREKGFDRILELARLAQLKALNIEILVVGHTVDDEALISTGKVQVTGEYTSDVEARTLIEGYQPHWGFIPSIWPETWCFTLTLLLEVVPATVVFDIGAQAERASQGSGVVLPLNISPDELLEFFMGALSGDGR